MANPYKKVKYEQRIYALFRKKIISRAGGYAVATPCGMGFISAKPFHDNTIMLSF